MPNMPLVTLLLACSMLAQGVAQNQQSSLPTVLSFPTTAAPSPASTDFSMAPTRRLIIPIPEEPEDLISPSFGFEMIFNPAWAGAAARTLLGGFSGSDRQPSQLTSSLPGDSVLYSIKTTCNELDGYTFGARDNFCALDKTYTQLVNGFVDKSFSSMSETCLQLGGISFGDRNQFCALEGTWTQLSARLPGFNSWHSGLDEICDDIGGTLFGNNMHCAVKGVYSQMTTRLPGDTSWQTSMGSSCSQLGGQSMGVFCILQGIWTQLTTKLPGDSSWQTNLNNVCGDLGGASFGKFCALEGPWTQFTTKLPGDSSWSTSMSSTCTNQLEGVSFKNYCVVQGTWSQLSTKIPGDLSWGTTMTSTCTTLGGISFGKYCAVEGDWTQFTTKLPGLSPWASSMATACDSLDGVSMDNYCFVQGASDPSGDPSSDGGASIDTSGSAPSIVAPTTGMILSALISLLVSRKCL